MLMMINRGSAGTLVLFICKNAVSSQCFPWKSAYEQRDTIYVMYRLSFLNNKFPLFYLATCLLPLYSSIY